MLTRHDVIDRLRKVAGDGDLPGAMLVGAGHVLVEIDLHDCDRYSALLEELRAIGAFTDLAATARALETCVHELDDQLALLEQDASLGLAVMRSANPVRDARGVEYWEAELHPGSVRLARYRKEHAHPDRERVQVPLLHRSLGALVEQMASALTTI